MLITPVDVRAMAAYLGIDAQREPTLMWIAKFALTEPLPLEWEEYAASCITPHSQSHCWQVPRRRSRAQMAQRRHTRR